MLAFVDESGDPGRKIINGSSRFFVVALVTFDDNEEAQACDNRIALLRREIGQPPGFEFHYTNNSKKVRQRFLEAVSPYSFFFHIFALNKDPDKLYGREFDFKESLYKYCAGLTFENAKPYLDNAIVVIDECGDRKFRDELAAYLRKRVRDREGRQLIKKVKVQRSSGNNLLQLADYVASISNRAICGKADALELRRRYLSTHELTNNTWPK